MKKAICWGLVIITVVALVYFLWLCLRPVKIIAVHNDGNFSSVLVDHFPMTVPGKITWWLENKEMLKSRHGIPKPAPNGNYSIVFWLFGEGYMEEGKYDRLCFMEMKTEKKCIKKDKTFTVNYAKNGGLYFLAHDGYYGITDKGIIIKLPSN